MNSGGSRFCRFGMRSIGKIRYWNEVRVNSNLLSENIEKSVYECLKDVRNRLKIYDDDTAEGLLRAFLENAETGSEVIV